MSTSHSKAVCSLYSTDVIYVSAAGSMLCQIINSLLLLPVSVARPLLSHLLDLLPPLDRLNRLLPAASPLEDQELQWPLHGQINTLMLHLKKKLVVVKSSEKIDVFYMQNQARPTACYCPVDLMLTFLPHQVHLTVLSQCLGCPCLSQHFPGCGLWTWSAQWHCWLAAAWVGCFREPPHRWRNRIRPTGSKRRSSATALRWTSPSWVRMAQILTIMDVLLVCFFCVLFLPDLAPPLPGATLPPQFVSLCSHVLL